MKERWKKEENEWVWKSDEKRRKCKDRKVLREEQRVRGPQMPKWVFGKGIFPAKTRNILPTVQAN